jgi:autotransporter-associated beta strand protein
MKRLSLAVVGAVSAVLGSASVGLAVSTWQGGWAFGPNSMAAGANWSGGTPTSSTTTDLLFSFGASTSAPFQDIAPTLNIRSFHVTGSSYTFNGPGYAFSNGTANTFSTGFSSTINVPFIFNGPTTFTSGISPVQGQLSGAGALTVAGGQLHVDPNTNNTFNGAVFVNGGSIFVPAGTTTAFNSPFYNLTDQSSLNIQGNGRLGGTPNLNFTNTGTFNPQAFFTGSQTVGNLIANGGGSTIIATNQLTLVGNVTSVGGSFSVNSGNLIDLNGSSHTFNTPAVTDSIVFSQSMTNGTFVKSGAGTVTLLSAAANTLTSPIAVNAGTLITSPSALALGGLNNGTIVFQNAGGAVGAPITGSGSVFIETNVTYNALNSYTGGTTVSGFNGGYLTGSSGTLHGTITGVSGGYVDLNEPAGSGNVTALFAGPLTVQKSGPGRSVLVNASTYNSTTSLTAGTLALADDNALGTSFLGMYGGNIEAVGTRVIANQFFGLSIAQGNIGIVGSGNLTFSDTSPKVISGFASLTHNSTGSTTYAGKMTATGGSTLVVNSGLLTLGDPTAVNGFVSQVGSQLAVNSGGSLKLQALNFISLPDVTLNGGNLLVPNGYAIPLSAVLQGNGSVAGRIASANGSSIVASGPLSLGDGAHVAGVNLDGELYTNQFAVVLNDANQAVLGSLTQLGSGTNNGSLTSAKGYVLNFGRNILGRGVINNGNTLANAAILNGDVNGDGPIFGVDALELTGYVKGVGTFNNTYFSGTYAPGLSPALVTVGMIGFTPTNILDIEVGGLNRGSQHDAIDATVAFYFGGTLKLSLINAFNPSLGNQFNLFDGPMFGTFSAYNFPALAPGLAWDTSLLYTQGIVQVVLPEPTSLLAIGTLTLLPRRRRA